MRLWRTTSARCSSSVGAAARVCRSHWCQAGEMVTSLWWVRGGHLTMRRLRPVSAPRASRNSQNVLPWRSRPKGLQLSVIEKLKTGFLFFSAFASNGVKSGCRHTNKDLTPPW